MPAHLRLLHVVPTADPRSGGPITALRERAAACRTLGAEVEILALDAPASSWLNDGGEASILPLGEGKGGFRFSRRLRPWLRRHADGYDAILVHGLWQHQTLAAWSALRGLRTPYFVFPHGMLDPWSRSRPLNFLKKQLYWLAVERRVIRDARAVLFTSEEERRLARGTFRPYACNELVIPYGVRAPQGDLTVQRAAFLERLGWPDDRRYLLFLGRLHPKKGCDLLLEAFAAIASRHPDLDLVVAGPDEIGWSTQLQAMADGRGIGSRVHWPGMLAGDAKWGALRAAEALALPSHQENFGLVVAEALACGTPALMSTKVNIWREVVEDGAGLAFADDAAGTRELLSAWLAQDGTQREAMSRRAQNAFARRYDLTASAPGYLAMLTELIRGLPCRESS